MSNDPSTYVRMQIFGTTTPFVGRRDALEQLYAATRSVAQTQTAGVIAVEGVSGVGKTRLVDEFVDLIDARRRNFRILRTAFPARLGGATAPLTQILRQRFGIKSTDSSKEARQRLIAELPSLVESQRVPEAIRLLGPLLHLPQDPGEVSFDPTTSPGFSTRVLQTAFNLVRIDASTSPVILTLDDWDHAPEIAHAWVAELISTVAHVPVLIVVLSRTKCTLPPLPDDVRIHSPVMLNPLNRADLTSLLEQFIGSSPEPHWIEQMLDRSQGLPRHLEELLRLLIQRAVLRPITNGGWSLDTARLTARPLPATLAEVAEERIENLDTPERDTLNAAATLGPRFWERGILSILRADTHDESSWEDDLNCPVATRLKASIRMLTDMDMIWTTPGTTLLGEQEYRFVAAAERDALLEALTPERRAWLARLAAQWMIGAKAAEPMAWQLAIADRFLESGARAGGGRHLRKAADLAASADDHERAVELYEKTLELLDNDQSELLHSTHMALADVLRIQGHFTQAEISYRAAHRHARITESRADVGDALARIGKIRRDQGRSTEAETYFKRALALHDESANLAGIAAVKEDIGKLHWHRGDTDAFLEGDRWFQESMHLHRELGDEASVARCLYDLGVMALHRRALKVAVEHHMESLRIRRRIGDRHGEVLSMNGLAGVHLEEGDSDAAMPLFLAARKLARTIGDQTLHAMVVANLGEAHHRIGHIPEALQFHEEAELLARELHHARILACTLSNHAQTLLVHGDFEQATRRCNEALDLAQEAEHRGIQALALTVRAEIRIQQMDAKDTRQAAEVAHAAEDLTHAEALFLDMGNLLDLPRVLESRARLCDLTEMAEEAKEHRARVERLRHNPQESVGGV